MSGPVVIELGDAAPWRPPEQAFARRPPRWLAVLVVAALAAGLPVADTAAGGPVLRVGTGALGMLPGGGRLFLTRFTGEGPHRLEAYDGGGAALWSRALADGRQVAYAGADVVLVTNQPTGLPAALATLSALDPGTGAELWSRGAASILGRAGELLLYEDTREWAGTEPAGLPALRVAAVRARTGALVWERSVPGGFPVTFGRDLRRPYDVTSFNVLDPDNTLRAYDLATGAVLRTDRLRGLGVPGGFQVGDDGRDGGPPGARAGQVAVFSSDTGDDEVYDRASGRLLWSAGPGGNGGLTGCATGLWCRRDGPALVALDAATGRPAWRADGYDSVIGGGRGALLLGLSRGTEATLLAVDARTGAVRRRLDGWHPIQADGNRVVVWRRDEDELAVIVGVVDPATGHVAVVGTGDAWGGPPGCAADGDLLACGVVGDMTAWRLPPAIRD
ncbi:PQQ-binding-like beta-propeller repeat protein [Dactylosporangium sp. CA-233914]|uniref:outer membrane protein assembly factor BamB family protein n=1 Tax=Dactylosporangium sp. CA-233914 TaxID=3239934 RepID=UPI003D919B62